MPIYRHVITGAGPAGDIWSTRIHSHSAVLNPPGAHIAWEAFLASVFGAGGVADWLADLTGTNEAITYALNPATGHATHMIRSAAAYAGNAGPQQPGPRDCTVVGLRTTVPGPAGRGRLFLPGVSGDNLTTTGLISVAARTGIAASVGNALIALNGAGYLPGIWSLGQGDDLRGVQTVTVGAVQGTQRRRSNKIPNSYITHAA